MSSLSISLIFPNPSAPVAVGDSNVPARIRLIAPNTNLDNILITSITITAESNVFQFSTTGTGGGAISGTNFTIAEAPSGTFTFTPLAPIILSPGSIGTIDFTFDVLQLPSANPTPVILTVTALILSTSIPPPLPITVTTTAQVIVIQICVAKDTMILMGDGTEKPIQNIRRGDFVAGDSEINVVYRVARVVRTQLSPVSPLRIVKINKNSINETQPSRDLIISSGHPILYNGKRYRAKSFKRFNGITYWDRSITANEILPIDDDNNTHSLYNIQYEHNGSFVANGVVVDSLPPLSVFAPLPRELYFIKEFYDKPLEIQMPKLCKEILKAKN